MHQLNRIRKKNKVITLETRLDIVKRFDNGKSMTLKHDLNKHNQSTTV